jgi:serine/threonine-protein kinase RsbW
MAQSSFRKKFSSLDNVFDFIGRSLETLHVTDEVSYAVQLSIEELFTNMVKYGQDSPEGVSIAIRREKEKLIIDLTERADVPFQVADAPDVDTSLPLEERKVGGLGIHLVRSLMDELHSEYADGLNRITLIKNLEP